MCFNRVDLSEVSMRNLSYELGIDLTKYSPLPNENKKDHKISFYRTLYDEICSCRDVYTLYSKKDEAFLYHTQDCYMNDVDQETFSTAVIGEVTEEIPEPVTSQTCELRTIPENGEVEEMLNAEKAKIILAALGENAKELFSSNKIVKKFKDTVKEMRAKLFPE